MHYQAQTPFYTDKNDCVDLELNKYERLIHLNIGKGVLAFHQKAINHYLFNDSHSEVINIYKNISNPTFTSEIKKIINNWHLIMDFSKICSNEIFITFSDFEKNIICLEDVHYMVRAIVLMNTDIDRFNELFSQSFLVSHDMFINSLIKCTVDQLEKNKGVYFHDSNTQFNLLIENSFNCGFFNHFQNMINLQNTNLVDCMEPQKQLAIWYFLSLTSRGNRMVYDANGNLKNQYAVDKQNIKLSDKLNFIENADYQKIIKNAELHNQPFHIFLGQLETNHKDLIVADFRSINLLKSSTRELKQLPIVNNLVKLLESKKTHWIILADFENSFNSVFGNSQLIQKRISNNNREYILLSNIEG